MRCHSQGLTIKLDRDIPLDEIVGMIDNDNQWVKLVPNDKEPTINELTPAAVNGTLEIFVGRPILVKTILVMERSFSLNSNLFISVIFLLRLPSFLCPCLS